MSPRDLPWEGWTLFRKWWSWSNLCRFRWWQIYDRLTYAPWLRCAGGRAAWWHTRTRSTTVVGGALSKLRPPFLLAVADFLVFLPTPLPLSQVINAVRFGLLGPCLRSHFHATMTFASVTRFAGSRIQNNTLGRYDFLDIFFCTNIYTCQMTIDYTKRWMEHFVAEVILWILYWSKNRNMCPIYACKGLYHAKFFL